MNQPYSAWADFLNELHALPEWIQALWLLAVPLTVVGTAYCAARAVRDVALALIDRRGVERGRPVYAIYETPDGRFMLYARGAVHELSSEGVAPPGAALPPLVKH